MNSFIYGKYLVKVLDFNNKKELQEVQRLRYLYLLKEFNESLPFEGLDDDGFDKYADSILVIDTTCDLIVGTYRLTTLETIGNNRFVSEKEFNFDNLKNSGFGICELGRACVHEDYRSGTVINLLWAGIFEYTKVNNIRYVFGTCSLHGSDPIVHSDTLMYLNKYCVDASLNIKAVKNVFCYPAIKEDADYDAIFENIPSLLKMYLKMGAKVSVNGYIDCKFNSCDVVTVVDIKNMNQRYFDFYQRFTKKH